MVSRRTFLKGLAAGASALVLPPTLTDNAEAARRFWALDSTMVAPEVDGVTTHITTATEYDAIYITDSSFIRRGDLLRISPDPLELWVPPSEYVAVESVLGHGIVSVRRG